MKQQDTLTSIYDLIFSPQDATREFIVSGATYGDISALAAAIVSHPSLSRETKSPVCLFTENKAFVAAALLASLAGGPALIIPYAFSANVLQEIREVFPFTKILTDQPGDMPEGLEVIRPQVQKKSAIKISLAAVRNPDDPFLILFTGGSTGRPKLWSKTPRNMLVEAFYLSKAYAITNQDIFLATVSPQHIYGLLFSVLLPMISSARVLADVYIFPQEIITAAEKHNATVLVSVPLHYRVMKSDNLQRHNLRIAFSSAGMLDEKDAAFFAEKTGVGIHEIYGSTETGGIAARCRAHGENSWKPFGKISWSIINERLHVRSAFLSPELERNIDGYFVTGDRAEYDGKSKFMLLGRADGIIKIAGKRVDLAEVEAKLKLIFGVYDAVVFSLPGKHGRENEITALVKATESETQIRKYLSRILEPYAIPRRIKVVDEIPITPAGKYDRAAIERIFQHHEGR